MSIGYKIVYEKTPADNAIKPPTLPDYVEIKFESLFNDNDKKSIITEFKKALKELLENQEDQEKIKEFIKQLLKVAEIKEVNLNNNNEKPFIFVIYNTKINYQKTYLNFYKPDNILKVVFNQYSLDLAHNNLFGVINDFFNEKLITMNYSGYQKLI